MGLPEILISFRKKASTAVRLGSRGLVAVLLDDDTGEQFLSPYRRLRDVREQDWSEESLTALKLIFKGSPQRVVAVRLLKKDGAADVSGTLNEIIALNADYLAYPGFTQANREDVLEFITRSHERGKKVKAVLAGCAADNEHVINLATASMTVKWEETDTTQVLGGGLYSCRIAGILAGLPLTQSCTCYVLDEVVDAQASPDPDADIDAGKLIVIFDGEKYKIGRGVTSLVKTSDEKPGELKKIKIVEGMDVILHDIYSTFEDDYIGKMANDYDNKQLFVGAVNGYFRQIQGSVLDGRAENYVEVDAQKNREFLESNPEYLKAGQDPADMTEQELKEANTGSWMFLTGSVRFLDASEDLKLDLFM